MVAAAGRAGRARAARGARLLLALAAALAARVFLSPRANIARFVALEKSPEILRSARGRSFRARDSESPPTPRTGSEPTTTSRLGRESRRVRRRSLAGRRGVRLSPGAGVLLRALAETGPYPSPIVDSSEPAAGRARHGEVWVDPRGRLLRLAIVPPRLANDRAPRRNRIGAPCFGRRASTSSDSRRRTALVSARFRGRPRRLGGPAPRASRT